MKTFLLLLFACATAFTPLQADPLYRRQIVAHGDPSPERQAAADALARWLEAMTGSPFEIVDQASDEDVIHLVPTLELLPKDRVEGEPNPENLESYLITPGKDGKGLYLVGTSPLGLRHAAFRYLHQLGYRSLYPGPNWQIVPKRSDIRFTKVLNETPAYLQRTFFGTGGFHSRLPLDPEGKVAKMWGDWQAANRFGSSIHLSGHYGEAFVKKHADTLAANPDYRAMVDGERAPMSAQFQLNYGNPGLRKLYIEDRLQDMRDRVAREPNTPRSRAVSVDPADGSGHCESPEAVALGSISDRVFGLANDVAKAIKAEFPGRFVNLYAYNMHCDVPAFSLEDNVIVSVIPYGFNRSRNLLGDDLLLAWGQKASLIGLYDYWALPDWSSGMPQLDFNHRVPEKIRFWYDHKVRFFNGESSTGAGTTGLGLYLASELLWDPKADDRAILNEFYDLAFGPAREPMQRMLERWAQEFLLHDNELGLSFRDLTQARQLAQGHPEVLARIDDYVTYVHYLRCLREYLALPRDNPDRHTAADALHRYLWQIRDNAMVQTFRLSQLLRNTWEGKDDALKAAWDYTDANASGWATVPPAPTSAEIATLLADGAKTYPVYFEPRTFSNDLVALTPPAAPAEETSESFFFFKTNHFQFQADRDGEIEFSLFLSDIKQPENGVVSIKEKGKQIASFDFATNGEWHPYRVPVQKGHVYEMQISGRRSHTRLRFPTTLPLAFHNGFLPIHWTSTQGYFFVPKGTERFALFVNQNPVFDKMVITGPHGGDVSPKSESKRDFILIDVPAGADGQVWSVSKVSSSYPIRLINLPDNVAFTEEGVLVPRDLAPEPAKAP